MSEPTIWLRGERTGLGPYVRDLVESYWQWENDPVTRVGFGQQVPESLESRTNGIDVQLKNSALPRFTVYDLASNEPVGVTSLMIDSAVSTAEFVINIAPQARGKGFGADATRLTVDYGFHVCNLRMIWLKVLAQNEAGRAAYANAGFKDAGRLRRAGYWLGKDCDEVIMDFVPSDFAGPSKVAALFVAS